MTDRTPTRALVFDLDGTLTDSAPAIRAALNAVWADRGRPPVPLEIVRGYIGDGPGPLVERARAALGLDGDPAAVRAETEAFLAAYAAGGPGGVAYPGVPETLATLRRQGWRLVVCTNKPQAAAETLLAALGLAPLLDGAVGGDRAPRQKPDPAHALAALDLIPGAAVADAVLVGDGPQDIAAAESAGIAVIVAAYGYGGAAEIRPDLPAIASIEELPRLLAAPPPRQAGESSRNGSI